MSLVQSHKIIPQCYYSRWWWRRIYS